MGRRAGEAGGEKKDRYQKWNEKGREQGGRCGTRGEAPSLGCLSPSFAFLLSFFIYSHFCSKKTGREVIPEHSPTNQPGFEPSVLLSKPISTAKATCQSLSNCPRFHPMAWICQVSKDQWDIPPTPHSRKEVEEVCKADTPSTCPGGR